ncbi:glutathione S-transferase L1-like [Abrus precatorius]|uniref:glutathione transferase n=1 Tax=Abrus precatorius TaxID=3816 RepID=A0A8B8L4D7_ABRPR|nr:glutathione S-transferase L1-like [Abrus precatorius]
MATSAVQELRTPPFTSSSDPPPLFDGTTRLYMSYTCPFAQRVWITRNYKELQDKIKLIPIDLANIPAWYKEKVYPPNKVPSLEHNGKVIGESLDLIKYVDANFEGISLFPSDPAKREFGEQVMIHIDELTKNIFSTFKGDPIPKTSASFYYIESALGKFNDGPFFLGQFSLVDAAFAPFLERFLIVFPDVYKHDLTTGRPNLAAYIEELNKIDAYTQTKLDAKAFLEMFKKRFLAQQ